MTHRTSVALIALHFTEYSAHLAMALCADHDVLLILYRNNADNELGEGWSTWLTAPKLQVLCLDRPRSPLAIVRNSMRLVFAVKSFAPSVLHYQEDIRDELALTMPFFRALAKVLTVHDPTPHSGRDTLRLRFSRLRIYRYLMRRNTDAAIAHGRVLVDALEKECPWLAGKVHSIPHGPLGLRNAVIQTTKPTVMRLLFFGRIHRYKGLQFFVEAVKNLHQAGLPVVGVVAGRGGDLDAHRHDMIAAGCFEIQDQFIPAAEVPTLFNTARVVVLPYTDGTQSGVAAMALGFGCPVVASAVGSIPELVRDGQNGLLVAPCDSNALTNAIRRVLLDDSLHARLVQGALRLRDGALSWTSIAAQTRVCYDSLTSGQRLAFHRDQ